MIDDGASRGIYPFGFYEPGTLEVMRRVLRPGDVFVDAGASVGMMSLFAAALVGPDGRVLSFEPLPKRFALLSESIRLNGLRNIVVRNIGLGSASMETTIFTDRISPSMVERPDSSAGVPVRVEPLADMLREEGISRVRMIKVDVEGFELPVLRGAEDILRGPEPPALCVEYGVYDGSREDLLSFLRSLPAYRLFNLAGTKSTVSKLREISPGSVPRNGDNIFCIPADWDIGS